MKVTNLIAIFGMVLNSAVKQPKKRLVASEPDEARPAIGARYRKVKTRLRGWHQDKKRQPL